MGRQTGRLREQGRSGTQERTRPNANKPSKRSRAASREEHTGVRCVGGQGVREELGLRLRARGEEAERGGRAQGHAFQISGPGLPSPHWNRPHICLGLGLGASASSSRHAIRGGFPLCPPVRCIWNREAAAGFPGLSRSHRVLATLSHCRLPAARLMDLARGVHRPPTHFSICPAGAQEGAEPH